MLESVFSSILNAQIAGTKLLAVLIDPDKHPLNRLAEITLHVCNLGGDFIFVGGSLLQSSFAEAVHIIKENSTIPVVIFPGNAMQISADADAFLLLSLISGRNPDFLIGQHVAAAYSLWNSGLEIIPTSYILIDGGTRTSVEYMSQTMPIPSMKPDIALATAMAGAMLGHKLIYLEAGSGASMPVPPATIRHIANHIQIPIIAGGGIRTTTQLSDAYTSGATLAVVGTHLEEHPNALAELVNVKKKF